METYEPGEDSGLLMTAALNWLEENAKKDTKILDMGTGSGVIIDDIKHWLHHQKITASLWAADIDNVEVPGGVEFVQSDLFERINEKFDLIVFNPPYLPVAKEDKYLTEKEKKQLIGGKRGSEVIVRFVKHLKDHLTPDGSALIIASSKGHPEDIEKTAEESGLWTQIIDEMSFPYEKLFVFLVRKAK